LSRKNFPTLAKKVSRIYVFDATFPAAGIFHARELKMAASQTDGNFPVGEIISFAPRFAQSLPA
jgi:hypothetical protein